MDFDGWIKLKTHSSYRYDGNGSVVAPKLLVTMKIVTTGTKRSTAASRVTAKSGFVVSSL